ncbi:unnamed protein product [Linum tenue]|uniref:Uncharacterized protein n=1 Tax=Linum tenue TaxID=586396 RepID=A0AAV0MXG8_9ROSI|nr:unnamed protein product [Linum tenue]
MEEPTEATNNNNGSSSSSSFHYRKSRVMSSEIVEIVELEENTVSVGRSCSSGVDGNGDVYVGVGRDDLDAVKWAVDHISPGARLFLVHVFPPIHYISTPVGRLSKSQLSKDQLRFYIKEENNRRRSLLQKYIRLCDDAKVPVDTMLLESSEIGKAIVELIPVLNITNLVLGTKLLPRPRRLIKKVGKAEYVKKNAPDYCQVTVVHQGKAIDLLHWEETRKQPTGARKNSRSASSSSRIQRVASMASPDRKFFQCACFSGKSH